MNDQTTNSQEQGKEAKKVFGDFKLNIEKLTAIVNGPEGLKPVKKIKKDATAELVAELFKEESEAKIKEVKEGLKALLKGHVVLQNSLAEERKKLDNLEISKKKEFNAQAIQLFNKIEGIDSILGDYRSAFAAAQEASTQETE